MDAKKPTPIETTEALREKKDAVNKRLAISDLQRKLGEKKCRHCLTVGKWKIYNTQGKVRYVHCLACGRSDSVMVD